MKRIAKWCGLSLSVVVLNAMAFEEVTIPNFKTPNSAAQPPQKNLNQNPFSGNLAVPQTGPSATQPVPPPPNQLMQAAPSDKMPLSAISGSVAPTSSAP